MMNHRGSPWLASLAAIAASATLSAAQATRAGEAAPLEPPPLHHEALALDADRGRLILFGGGTYANGRPVGHLRDTWEWDGTRWRITLDSAASPSPRSSHAMAYDPIQKRVMLFGGQYQPVESSSPGAPLCDTWLYDGRRWTRVIDGTSCLTTRTAGASLLFHTGERAMLLVEGPPAPPRDLEPRPLRLWRWSGAAWVLIDSTGPRGSGGSVAFDERRRALVLPVFSGPDAGVWEWGAQGWKRHDAAGPIGRSRFALAYDPVLERVVLIGGLGLSPRVFLGDAWSWDGATWSRLPNNGVQPSARSNSTLVSDSRQNRLLYFGGTADGRLFQELWLYERSGWRTWSGRTPHP